MAAFGSSYPGVNQPAWWYADTTTWTSSSTTLYPTITAQSPEAAPPSRPKTAVEWLRGRVQEMCDLAGLADA